MTLYKDSNNNLWNCIGYDEQSKMHIVTVVDDDEGYYTDTGITWPMTNEEFAECTKIEVEV